MSNTTGNEAVKVRMYRQGLGDCFLITIPRAQDRAFFILIDCGVVLGTSKPEEGMAKVVGNIIEATKGEGKRGRIDLLVATHEHWDHVSGFLQAKELFDTIDVGQVWLAWTEDPNDPLASKLRAERRRAENALRMAATRLALEGSGTASKVNDLVGFFGAKAGSTKDALNVVKSKASGKPRYCQPGEPPISIEELEGVRFFVLGPPKNEKLIKKSNPGKGEAYGLDAGPGGSQALLATALAKGLPVDDGAFGFSDDWLEDPFDGQFGIPLSRARQMPFFAARYFGEAQDDGIFDVNEKDAESARYRDQSWRRIDTAWMEGAETMALQLDSATNNTSLVLAIELPSGGILLFPGDAQAGNWLSWQSLSWQVDNPPAKEPVTVTGPDLLARTIFYKVGHHGSHNATLQQLGLEQMVSEDLVAMIPVDHKMAVTKHWDRMPLPDLVNRLSARTKGRVLRIDDKVKSVADLATFKPKSTPDADAIWTAFISRVTVDELFYEISF